MNRATRAIMVLLFFVCPFESGVFAQSNCPSGIQIYVNSGNEMVSLWSPVAGNDYQISRGWNDGTHSGRDIYSLDLNLPGRDDLDKPAFLPMTGRVWTAYRPGTADAPNYGNTVLIWDPGSGILVRLAHLDGFSSLLERTAAGSWLGAGEKAGFIGETGCPGCGTHLHETVYRNVRVGVVYANRTATEQDIVDFLSQGRTPAFAESQKFRMIAPSDNCDLVMFSDSQTVYTNQNQTLYPVTFDVWRSWGLSIDLTPHAGQYDSFAGRIPIRTLASSERRSFNISSEFAWPRRESVFRGYIYPDTYVFRYGRKYLLNSNQFGDQSWNEFRWAEIQFMDQNFVDQLEPKTVRNGSAQSGLDAARSDLKRVLAADSRFAPVNLMNEQISEDLNWDSNWELRWGLFMYRGRQWTSVYHATNKANRSSRYYLIYNPDTSIFEGWFWAGN